MIYVFKTSVNKENQLKKLKPHIDKLIPFAKWNFDLEDCDNILRIDSEENISLTIKTLFKIFNFECEELE
ncbi:hypothetical protein [Flavobacterium sp.]|jgi:hypothetical protein|uniref:hypothetical protein n=1 Tax=Flavobacterium sp. TaxID=239 RepID=UPI0038FCC2F4